MTPGGWSSGSTPLPGFFDDDGEEYPSRAAVKRLKEEIALPALPPPSGLPPVPARSVCGKCGAEVLNSALEDHHLTSHNKVPVTAIAPIAAMLDLTGGTKTWLTSKAVYTKFPDGRMVTKRYDGTIFTGSPCPRCRALVDVTRPERHMHCAFVNCSAVWDLKTSTPRVIAEHVIDDVIWKAHAIQLSRAAMEQYVQLLEVRPDVAEAQLAMLLRRHGFTVTRNTRTGLPCEACGHTIAGPVSVEKIAGRWIHVLCPNAIPRPRRLGSPAPASRGST